VSVPIINEHLIVASIFSNLINVFGRARSRATNKSEILQTGHVASNSMIYNTISTYYNIMTVIIVPYLLRKHKVR
jgi:hypothetical protein